MMLRREVSNSLAQRRCVGMKEERHRFFADWVSLDMHLCLES
jgi:hypothetical protein